MGSPLAVFLALRGIRPGNSGSQDHILPKTICNRLLNIFHPTDPVVSFNGSCKLLPRLFVSISFVIMCESIRVSPSTGLFVNECLGVCNCRITINK